MSLFKSKKPAVVLTPEEYKDAVANALAPLNADYAWEIAEPEAVLHNGVNLVSQRAFNMLWLVKIEGDITVRIQGYPVNTSKIRSVEFISTSLLNENPRAKPDDMSKTLIGFYKNIPTKVKS